MNLNEPRICDPINCEEIFGQSKAENPWNPSMWEWNSKHRKNELKRWWQPTSEVNQVNIYSDFFFAGFRPLTLQLLISHFDWSQTCYWIRIWLVLLRSTSWTIQSKFWKFFHSLLFILCVTEFWNCVRKNHAMRHDHVAAKRITNFMSWPKCFHYPPPSPVSSTRLPLSDSPLATWNCETLHSTAILHGIGRQVTPAKSSRVSTYICEQFFTSFPII